MKELYQIASEGDDHWWKDSTNRSVEMEVQNM
jgi:hypothetical protein